MDALKAERNAAKQEAVSARQDAVTRAEADRKRIDGLMIQAQDMRAEIERLKSHGSIRSRRVSTSRMTMETCARFTSVCRGVSAEHWLDMGI